MRQNVKYSTDEAIKEIVKRGKKIRRKRADRITHALCACMSALVIILVCAFSIFAGNGIREPQTYYGSLVFSSDIGLYVLIGVLSFWLGILVAVILVKKSHKNKNNNQKTL